MEMQNNFFAARRLKMGLTIIEMSHRIGCSPQAIGQWESGKVIPGGRLLRKLAEAYEATAEEIMDAIAEAPARKRSGPAKKGKVVV